MHSRHQLFEELFHVLDINDLNASFREFLDVYDLDNQEAVDAFWGLYTIAYYKVRDKFEHYLRTNPDVAMQFDKILAQKSPKIELLRAIDTISLAVFNTTFMDQIEKELKQMFKELSSQGKLAIQLGQYIALIAEKDPQQAEKISEYVADKRYAKVLSLIKNV